MKTLKSFAALMSAFALASAFGSGIAYGDEAAATEPTSDIDTHIFSFGDSLDIETLSVKVPYGDLNLNNEKGVAVLYRRLKAASKSVCGIQLARKQKCPRCMRLARDCYEDALSRSVAAVGSELLLALHQGTELPETYAATTK